MTRLYIGNLPLDIAEDDIKALFTPYDRSVKLSLKKHRRTGHGRGFGFVDIDPAQRTHVLEALNGVTFKGRRLRVEVAKESPATPRLHGARRSRLRVPFERRGQQRGRATLHLPESE